MSDDQSVSRNALTEQDYERLDRIIANRRSVGFGWVATFELAEALAEEGHRLIPAMGPGGHTKIVLSTGLELSLSAFNVLTRAVILEEARCAECANPLAVTPFEDRRIRSTRLDAVYCSNRCRQRAYRKRTRGEEP